MILFDSGGGSLHSRIIFALLTAVADGSSVATLKATRKCCVPVVASPRSEIFTSSYTLSKFFGERWNKLHAHFDYRTCFSPFQGARSELRESNTRTPATPGFGTFWRVVLKYIASAHTRSPIHDGNLGTRKMMVASTLLQMGEELKHPLRSKQPPPFSCDSRFWLDLTRHVLPRHVHFT